VRHSRQQALHPAAVWLLIVIDYIAVFVEIGRQPPKTKALHQNKAGLLSSSKINIAA